MYEITVDRTLVCPWVCQRTGGEYIPGEESGIGLIVDGVLMAGTTYGMNNGRSCLIHVAVDSGCPLVPEYVFSCFDYPFNQLGLIKLIGLVDSTNDRAIRLDKHLGFHLEATLKDAAPKGDLLIFSMTREQCKWLRLGDRYGKQRGQEP